MNRHSFSDWEMEGSSNVMELMEALKGKKKEILALWVERTLNSYSSPGFFKKSKDQFANPVGSSIVSGLTGVYELLLDKADIDAFQEPLDQVIRIRAVQEFSPAQAIAPILELKWVVKQVLAKDSKVSPSVKEIDFFDCDVDRVALKAFDIYTACREQLYQGRIRELKSGRHIITDSGCPSSIMGETPQNG